MTQPEIPTELATAIREVYSGPLEEFVTRRGELVKQLRATRQREAADRVKALRKPSRMAWVLDSIVHENPASIDRLDAAITEAQTGADLRAAAETVKAAVRDAAAVGARIAVRARQPDEPNALISALHAVIGDARAFAELRAGLLIEVPEGGGLDLLLTVVRDQPVMTTPPSLPAKAQAEDSEPRLKQNAELAKAARANLRRTEMALVKVGKSSKHALQSVVDAENRLESAERVLMHAQSEAQNRRADLEHARRAAEVASEGLQEAEQAVSAARARVADTDSSAT